jgi:hypothetical protein
MTSVSLHFSTWARRLEKFVLALCTLTDFMRKKISPVSPLGQIELLSELNPSQFPPEKAEFPAGSGLADLPTSQPN